MRTIDWQDGVIKLIDQTLLPHELVLREVADIETLIADIKRLAVRGAPALGVAGALGVALLAQKLADPAAVRREAQRLREARPTAVNLSWGVDQALAVIDDGADAVLAKALEVRDADIRACVSMGLYGAETVRSITGKEQVRMMTICNTGGLATVERGTALGVIQTLLEQGSLTQTLACETRPLLQGARLTAWELKNMGAPFKLIVDSAGPFLLSRGAADAVVIGADRIAANGDTANKIGSFSLALAAKYAGVPFFVVAPESTIDMQTTTGKDIEIEDRGVTEIAELNGVRTAPADIEGLNPAFDVTPHSLITGIITERRVIHLDRGQTLAETPLGELRVAAQ
ncbi:S-methyl-5-thioribose-1-phosphate isomerase [Canibacter zhoujuaniae]|uniref:S-methyl-5-thioribose-1-phosphate isomerase n=1 Tax=Canibacter zhoujuaniae TaxID=2708343 RepID=UPI001423F9CB|nr:S-methyl-5-thioribose-1-phosphate isomerase [Canibacter zhoujuaniae]